MFEQVFNAALSNGLWATLFVALLLYVLKDGNYREKKYQETIDSLNKNLNVVNDIKIDVDKITQTLSKKN